MIALVLLACSGGDPELGGQKRALDAWIVGRDALEAGDPVRAADAFAKAHDAEPDDPLLEAWQARALADQGELEAAVALLHDVLVRAPRFAEARYNRAAYLARLGRLEEAGPELARAIDDGAARSREAMVDPDFVPHLADPAFAFLPDEMLIVALDAPSGTLFWGSEATVRLRIVGAQGAPVTIEAAELSGPLELVSAVEDVVDSTEGPVRDVSWTFKVRGAGEAVLGPFTVRSGPWSSQVRAVRFPMTAPPGKGLTDGAPPLSLALPTEVGVGLEVPGVRYEAGVLDVKSLPNDRVRITPKPTGSPVRYELRDRSRPSWVVQRHVLPAAPEVVVQRGTEVVLESRGLGGTGD
ncbi:MAG: tetratricopeptide repeat protein [Myxococcota bacterium]